MKLDKSKKYEFCGEVYAWGTGFERWDSPTRGWRDTAFQLFADNGHVKEVRDPLVFEGEVMFSDDEVGTCFTGITESRSLPESDRKGKRFKVTWTEVVK